MFVRWPLGRCSHITKPRVCYVKKAKKPIPIAYLCFLVLCSCDTSTVLRCNNQPQSDNADRLLPRECDAYDLVAGDPRIAAIIWMNTASHPLMVDDGRCASALIQQGSSFTVGGVVAQQDSPHDVQLEDAALNQFTNGACEAFQSCSHRIMDGVRIISFANPDLKDITKTGRARMNMPYGPVIYVGRSADFFRRLSAQKNKSGHARLEKKPGNSQCRMRSAVR